MALRLWKPKRIDVFMEVFAEQPDHTSFTLALDQFGRCCLIIGRTPKRRGEPQAVANPEAPGLSQPV